MESNEPPGFARFWAAWPRNSSGYSRKGAKAKCLQVWKKNYNESQADVICRHVEWLSRTADWLKDGGAFIPAPLVYLHQARWDGADIPDPPATSVPAQTSGYLADLAAHKAQATTGTAEQRQKLEALRNGSVLKRII